MKMDTMKFDLPARCSVGSVTIREVSGRDEVAAAKVAEAKKSGAYTELIRLSIIEVDGKAVTPPGTAPLDEWSTRTRKAVSRYFDELNDVTEAALDPFIKAAHGLAEPPEEKTAK